MTRQRRSIAKIENFPSKTFRPADIWNVPPQQAEQITSDDDSAASKKDETFAAYADEVVVQHCKKIAMHYNSIFSSVGSIAAAVSVSPFLLTTYHSHLQAFPHSKCAEEPKFLQPPRLLLQQVTVILMIASYWHFQLKLRIRKTAVETVLLSMSFNRPVNDPLSFVFVRLNVAEVRTVMLINCFRLLTILPHTELKFPLHRQKLSFYGRRSGLKQRFWKCVRVMLVEIERATRNGMWFKYALKVHAGFLFSDACCEYWKKLKKYFEYLQY